MQEQPVVFGAQFDIQRWIHQGGQLRLEALEQLQDHRLLAVKVVIEIAGADAHFSGDFEGGNIGFALLIEQGQGAFEDAVASLHCMRILWPRGESTITGWRLSGQSFP
ncbi:hypothetical protein D3C84_885330 [compost metagenome]